MLTVQPLLAGPSTARTPTTTSSTTGTANGNEASDGPTIELVRQAPVLALGAPVFHLDLRLVHAEQIPTRARFEFELARPVTSLVEFDDVVHGGRLPPSIDSPVVVRLADTTRAGDTVGVDIPIQTPRDPVGLRATLRIKEGGIYPLRISLNGLGTRTTPEFTTWLVVQDPRATPHPESVAWVWQLDTPTTAANAVAPAELRRLERLASLIAAGHGVPMSVVVHGQALAGWESAATQAGDRATARFQALRARLDDEDRSVIAAPWVRTDPLALSTSGFADTYRDERLRTITMLRDRWSIPTDTTTAWLDLADDAALRAERLLGTQHLGFGTDALVPVDAALEGERFTVQGSPIDSVAASARLAELLFDDATPAALRAQRAAAALALDAATAPSARDGVVISTPADWRGDASLVAAMVRVLDTHALSTPVSLGALPGVLGPGTDGRGGPLVRALRTRTPQRLAVAAVDLDATQRRITGAVSLSADGATRDDISDEVFLRALSTTVSTPDAGRLLAVANRRITDFAAGVTATAQSVTVTSERARIPVRFTNDTGVAVRVRVELRSSKLRQNNGPLVVLLPATPTNHTEVVPVTVKGSGQFRVALVVTSPDGRLPLGAPDSVSVNSTVFGSYGIWLTWGAGVFLALWWIHHAWSRRRKQATA